MDDIIVRIKHKLAYLQQQDDGDRMGASIERQLQIGNHYPYLIDPPHTEKEISAFEAEEEIQLPEDYRRFLLEVGRGCHDGANPGYYMYSPLDSDREVMAQENWDVPFPFDNTMNDEDLERYAEQHGLWSPEDDRPLDTLDFLTEGYFWIVYDGCQCWYMLVMTGPARGQIWYVDGLNYFAPVTSRSKKISDGRDDTPTQRLTFTQWYEAWLNKQIRIAQEHWQKRGRTVPPLVID
jgi:hypothetical protein